MEARFHAVPNDLIALERVQQRITGDFAMLRARAIVVYAYWPDMITGLEQIQLVNATPEQVEFVLTRYGSGLVHVASLRDPPPIVAL